MQKRGQITFYVVIGILIFAMIVFVIGFRNQVFKTAWDIERFRALDVPEQAAAIQENILSCIGEISEEGVLRLTSQGGFIELPQDTYPQTPINKFSNSLQVLQKSDIKVAYWSYLSANNVPKRNVPTKEDMQRELSSYMDRNLARCINNLTAYSKYNVEVGQALTETQIESERIKYTVNFPVHVTFNDFEFNFPVFYYEHAYRLGYLYDKANDILDNLDNKNFIEEKTLDALSVYQSIPFSGTETTCSPKIWLKPNVENEIKKALGLNIPAMHVSGTSFKEGNKYFVIDALSNKDSGLSVKFDYLQNWPFYFEVQPSDGIVLKTEPILPRNIKELSYISSLLCITDYRFIYDLRYPVLITLRDTDSGDTFQFAYLAVIDNNQPKLDVLSEDLEPNTNIICQSPGSEQTVSVVESAGQGLVPSASANVIFKCANSACDMGATRSTTQKGTLTTLFPQCVNGFISAEKEGYVSTKEQVTTVESGNQFTVRLKKLQLLNVKVMFLDNGFERNPGSEEAATITLTNEDSEYATTITSDDPRVKLAPGIYKMSSLAIATSDAGFEIPSREITKCVNVPVRGITGIFGAEEEKCFTTTTEPINLNTVMIGGGNQEFTIPENELYNLNDITFYVLVTGIPTTPEQLSGITESIDIGQNTRPPRLA